MHRMRNRKPPAEEPARRAHGPERSKRALDDEALEAVAGGKSVDISDRVNPLKGRAFGDLRLDPAGKE